MAAAAAVAACTSSVACSPPGGAAPRAPAPAPAPAPAAAAAVEPDPRGARCAAPDSTSTATASVRILTCDFPIPTLDRTRRVWIYLPPDYHTTADRYPVLYMHDGQNIFDAATSYVGEWGVDETLDSLAHAGDRPAIVVAVDHGGERRFDEYSPWVNDRYGGGEGEAYVEFLVETLKPFVDDRYRTLPGRESTGIAGSSMGGLISLYAALRHPGTFGRIGVFSPAFWVTPEIHDYAADALPLPAGTRVYMITGGREGDEPELYIRHHERMAGLLRAAGTRAGAEVRTLIRPEGIHNESFWRQEFPAAYVWLFGR